MNKLWILKSRGCVKYLKLVSPRSLREYSRRAQPATAIPEKTVDDELIELETTVNPKNVAEAAMKNDVALAASSQVLRQQQQLHHHQQQQQQKHPPIVFVKKNNQLLDLTRKKSLANEGCIFDKDLERLLQLYDHQSDKGSYEKVKSTSVTPLKLVNAISPSELEWKEQTPDLSKLLQHYMKLSKFRLTGLVVITTLGGYLMAPASLNLATLTLTCLGTGLTSASANSINQFFEVPFDSQMSRTKNRVLVRGILTPLHVTTFAAVCGFSGVTVLALGANELTAILGASNLILYTLIYTPMKRYSILNTWIGSIVGAIPPIMGWVACTGTIDMGALLLGAILFAWQFPHFNALSWNLRGDYSRGGYRMMSVTSPDLCRRTALRYSVILLGLCTAVPAANVTTWTFAVDSLPVNLYFIYLAWQFHRKADAQSSRKLFRASLLYLPVIMTLLAISKKPYSKTNEK